MVDNSEIARINKLTFGELRNELANCRNNPVREKVIRNLMCIRYNQHLQKKIQIEQFKKEQKRKQIMKIKNKLEEKYKYKLNENYNKPDDLLDFVDNDEKVQFDKNDFNNINENDLNNINENDFKNDFKNELDETNELYDSRNITEYGRDYANNNLMERLNIDMNLRKDTPIVKNKKDFATPYSNNPGTQFAPFNNFPKSQKNNFSNYKQNKQNKRN